MGRVKIENQNIIQLTMDDILDKEIEMIKIDKVLKSLQLCSQKDCKNCPYNKWVYGVCQKYLFRDAIEIIADWRDIYGNEKNR